MLPKKVASEYVQKLTNVNSNEVLLYAQLTNIGFHGNLKFHHNPYIFYQF